jgi:hypothetical protein
MDSAPSSSSAEHPVSLEVTDDLRRSRLTVFFRLILAIPHLLWLWLWSFLAFVAAIANWLATVIAGKSPQSLHDFLGAYVRYSTHVNAYVYLVANPFPGFTGQPGSYPIDVEIAPPESQNRLMSAFRIILAIPALILTGVLQYVYQIIGFLGWFVSLALGRMPQGMRDLSAYCLRFQAQTYAYTVLLTQRYPSLSSAPTA